MAMPVNKDHAGRRMAICKALKLTTIFVSITFAVEAVAQQSAAIVDPLADGFRNPPAEARPRVWWHWMNGNITKDGIAKDLAWMKRIGIGGVQTFDVNLNTPAVVSEPRPYMTPTWKDAFRFAVTRAKELDLDFTIASSPGWSETGGPWVPPADGMKKMVWSQVDVSGGRLLSIKLPAPPTVTGAFQNYVEKDTGGIFSTPSGTPVPQYYADAKVIAYRLKNTGRDVMPLRITLAGKSVDAGPLNDTSYESFVKVDPGTPKQPSILDIELPKKQTIRSASFFSPGASSMFARPSLSPQLQVSNDRKSWRTVADFYISQVPATVGFAPITSRYFRVVLADHPSRSNYAFTPAPGVAAGPPPSGKPRMLAIADLRLSTEARIDAFEVKAGFAIARDYDKLEKRDGLNEEGINPATVVDLTEKLRPNGNLVWMPPKGEWRIMRIGYSLTGKTNHPASAAATGLEVDKIDSAAVRRYLDRYFSMYRDALGTSDTAGAAGLTGLLTDSTEVGAFNWTPAILEHFKRLRGYDPVPYLPALTGTIVRSRGDSDRFLYDFRRTLADLHATEHYRTVADVAHEQGLKVYGEALETGRPALGDDLDLRSYADIPMGALWSFPRNTPPVDSSYADLKGASSVAHVYGRPYAAAESMTSALNLWSHSPADLRHVIDFEFAQGINRPVIHTSVHQPIDKAPGLSLMFFGQFFNRHESWGEMARPWIDYMSRNSFMLQQGHNIADVAYFAGEGSPLVAQAEDGYFTDIPRRYGYDFVSARALRDDITVQDTNLLSRGGSRYKVLFLGKGSARMTLPTLQRIAALVDAGATVIGSPPTASPSLADDKATFTALIARLWSGSANTKSGAGHVIAGNNIEQSLEKLGVIPDFEIVSEQDGAQIPFVHRRLPYSDIYYLNNRSNTPIAVKARFRVDNKMPEIWRADTGATSQASYQVDGDGVVMPLEMEANESFFVVFRGTSTKPQRVVPNARLSITAKLDGQWRVEFQKDRGAPAQITLPTLQPLNEHADPGVRYFSGEAIYRQNFNAPSVAKGKKTWLDLGMVGDLAEVTLNGRLVGTAWHAPYRLETTNIIRKGVNRIEIRVANLWVNRLVGDAQAGAKKLTFTTIPTYSADAPLRPSGLIGPVSLLASDK